MTIGKVRFDDYGVVVYLKGKKGERRVRLIASAPALANWLEHHPFRDKPDVAIWINVGTTNHGRPMDYAAARKLLRDLGKKAGLKKRVNPYAFRHSRITHMANLLTEAQMCEYFGWKQGSKMPRVYVHLSGRDIDDRLLELHGLKPKEENRLNLKVQICPRCKTKNSPSNRFCSRCGSALNLKAALEVDRRIRRAEEVMETLLENPEVKAFLAEKLKELGLAEKLA